MAFTTANMSLAAWDLESDPYDHSDLVNNWLAIDAHDHTPGRGAPLTSDSIPVLDQDNLGPCSVSSLQICDGAVINQKIALNAVRGPNIANDSVDGSKLTNDSVTSDELAANAVSSSEIQDGAVTANELANNSVTNAKINNGAVSTDKLGNLAVTSTKLGNAAVTSTKIAAISVQNSHLTTNAVTKTNLANDSVGPAELDVLPSAHLVINGAQAVAPNTFHTVDWHVASWDTDGMTHPGGFTIQTSGIYIVTAGLLWSDGAQSGTRRARIRVNGTPFAGVGPTSPTQDDPSSPYRVRHSLSGIMRLWVGDQIDLLVQHTAGGNSQLQPDGYNTHLACSFLTRSA